MKQKIKSFIKAIVGLLGLEIGREKLHDKKVTEISIRSKKTKLCYFSYSSVWVYQMYEALRRRKESKLLSNLEKTNTLKLGKI